MAARIAKGGDDFFRPGGVVREVAVLFSDIRGFTRLTAHVLYLLLSYYAEMVATVFTNVGTLGKFIGDAIMVIFGSAEPDPARRALETVLALREALERRIAAGAAACQGCGCPCRPAPGRQCRHARAAGAHGDRRYGQHRKLDRGGVQTAWPRPAEFGGSSRQGRRRLPARSGKTDPIQLYAVLGHTAADQDEDVILQAIPWVMEMDEAEDDAPTPAVANGLVLVRGAA